MERFMEKHIQSRECKTHFLRALGLTGDEFDQEIKRSR